MLDGGVMVNRTNAPESGVAKAYTFSPMNDALLHTTQILKEVDVWVEEWYKYYTNQADASWEANTNYRTDFSPKMSLSLIELTELLETMEGRNLEDNAKNIIKKIILEANDGEKMLVQDLLKEVDLKYRKTQEELDQG